VSILPKPVDRTTYRSIARAAALAACLLLAAAPAPAQELINRVVIRVNDRIATLHDYQQRVAERIDAISRSERPLAERREAIARTPEQVYSEMLQELLLLSRADQAGIVYAEDEIDAQVGRIRESYGIDSEAEFREALASQNLGEREFREQVLTGMRIQELLGREVRSQLDVGEELARAYYRDNPEAFMAPQRMHLREVVVLDESPLTTEERLALARSIREEIAAGRAVEELVEQYREAGTVSGVADLGWVAGGDLAPEIQAAVWDLGPNEVSEPIEGRGGLHVVQVVEREEEGLRGFADVAEEAERRATNVAFAEAMQDYLQKLERQSYVDLAPPPEAADFRTTAPGSLPALPDPTEAAQAAEPEQLAPPPEDLASPPDAPADGP
jgi:peptidyl-prolyl cis-trans isomerase SurA